MKSFDNKDCNVVISGGTQGLGFAIAKKLAFNGCKKIVLLGRDRQKGIKASNEICEMQTDCFYKKCDVSIAEDCKEAIKYSIKKLGYVNGLVNSAAITSRGSIFDTSEDLWNEHLNTNLRGPFLLIQGLVKHLTEKKIEGSIVNILSTSAHVGQSYLTPYSTSKGGLLTLTKNLANSLKEFKIRVNGVAPGWMDTPGEDFIQKTFHNAKNDWLEKAEKTRPFGKLIKTKEISPLIAYLLSSNSGVITGSIIDYDQQIIGAVSE